MLRIIDSIRSWKLSLPVQLRPESVKDWNEDGLWTLVLMAWCYRMECNIYRNLNKTFGAIDDSNACYTQRLQTAVSELNIVVKRAVTHKVGKLLPMSL